MHLIAQRLALLREVGYTLKQWLAVLPNGTKKRKRKNKNKNKGTSLCEDDYESTSSSEDDEEINRR